MYNPTKWTDRVVDADSGEVIQEGTDQSAANFNNMESGIYDAHVAAALLQIAANLMGADMKKFEVIEGTLAVGRIHAVDYPYGFTKDNCVVVSLMLANAASDTNPINYLFTGAGDEAGVVEVSLQNDHVSIANDSALCSYNYKVVLCKYK